MTTTRELIATTLNDSITLRNLGLPADSVFQADTTDSPEQRPFLVIRWGTRQVGIGPVTVRPYVIWCYDEMGDPSRAEHIVQAAATILAAMPQTPVEGGLFSQNVKGVQMDDLQDDGYEALVIPHSMTARASGV